MAVVGDAVETVVETVTDTAENVLDAGADAMEDSVDYVVDWVNINGGAVLGGIANVIGGIVSGAIDAVQQLVGAVLHIVKDVGAIVGSLLRLDLPGLINAVLHLLIDVGILIVDALRTVLLGFFIGHIVENFDRNSLRRFVGRLLGNTLAEPRLTQVRNALRMSDPLWGLRPHVMHKTLVMAACRHAQGRHARPVLDGGSLVVQFIRDLQAALHRQMARQERQRVHLSGIPLPHRQVPRRRPAQSPDLRADRVKAERPNSVCDQALQRHGHQADMESFHHRAPADAACDARTEGNSVRAWRCAMYPGYFSKMVMAHEMGHYFGLCHINHNGVQNIMFSNAAGNSYADWGLFGYYLNAEPYFTSRDKRNVWRFIVDQLRNEL